MALYSPWPRSMSAKLSLVVVLLSVSLTFCNASPECNVELEPEEVRQRRIEALKAQFLSKLGMTEAPNVDASRMGPISQDILESYQAAQARRKRRSLEEAGSTLSPEDHYYEQRISLIPAALQGTWMFAKAKLFFGPNATGVWNHYGQRGSGRNWRRTVPVGQKERPNMYRRSPTLFHKMHDFLQVSFFFCSLFMSLFFFEKKWITNFAFIIVNFNSLPACAILGMLGMRLTIELLNKPEQFLCFLIAFKFLFPLYFLIALLFLFPVCSFCQRWHPERPDCLQGQSVWTAMASERQLDWYCWSRAASTPQTSRPHDEWHERSQRRVVSSTI